MPEKIEKLCFVYGLVAQMEERRIVSPEVAGSSPVQVAKCLLRLGGQDIRFPSGGRGFKSRRGSTENGSQLFRREIGSKLW